MEYMVSNLAQGCFANSEAAVYGLLLNQYVYVGKTGTSSGTGRSSPIRRLTFHIEKRANTHSIIWDDIMPNSLTAAEDLAIKMVSFFVPRNLDAGKIERVAIQILQDRLEGSLLRNSPVRQLSQETTDDERETANRFIERLLDERGHWLRTEYTISSQQDSHSGQHDGEE